MPQKNCSAECKKKVMRGRRADQTEAASGGKGHNIRATVRAVQSTRLVWNDKPRYYNGGSKRKNCLEVKVVEEMKSAGGDIVRVVDPKDVKVGLVVVPDANTPIDPVKAEMIEVFKKGGKRKGQEEPNPVRPVHGHPGRFHLEGGTSQSHEKKCFFAVKVVVKTTGASTIADFIFNDGRSKDRIWWMAGRSFPKTKGDAAKQGSAKRALKDASTALPETRRSAKRMRCAPQLTPPTSDEECGSDIDAADIGMFVPMGPRPILHRLYSAPARIGMSRPLFDGHAGIGLTGPRFDDPFDDNTDIGTGELRGEASIEFMRGVIDALGEDLPPSLWLPLL